MKIALIKSYIDKQYYLGKFIRWLLEDEKGVSVKCHHCGNIANGIMKIERAHTYNIPLCKKHMKDTFPNKDFTLPNIITYQNTQP